MCHQQRCYLFNGFPKTAGIEENLSLLHNSPRVAEITGDVDQTRILRALSVMSQRTSAGQVSG